MPRGFANETDPEKRRALSAKGGRSAHASGRAHEFTSDEARVAGKLGGQKVSRDRTHMAAIGKIGGQAAKRKKASQNA